MNTNRTVLDGPDAPPIDRDLRERLESTSFGRGFLVGGALSLIVWIPVASALAAAAALR